MFDNQHTWNSTPNSLLPGIQQTKHYFRSTTYSRKKILVADKSDSHVLYQIS